MFLLGLCAIMFVTAVPVLAETEGAGTGNYSVGASLRYIAAALAVGLCALATSFAQGRIGAAGIGSIVEKPETAGTVIILVAIPETMVILGFVVAAMIIMI